MNSEHLINLEYFEKFYFPGETKNVVEIRGQMH